MESKKGSEKFTYVSNGSANKKEKNNNKIKEYDINKTFYFGFKQRVIAIIILIIMVFGLGSFLIINSYRIKKGNVVTYNENSIVNYKVCLVENDFYQDSCLNENMLYNSSLVNNIPVNYKYDLSFSEDLDYQLYYHVILYNKIYDTSNNKKILEICDIYC